MIAKNTILFLIALAVIGWLLWKVSKTLAIIVILVFAAIYAYRGYKYFMLTSCLEQQKTTGTNSDPTVCDKYKI